MKTSEKYRIAKDRFRNRMHRQWLESQLEIARYDHWLGDTRAALWRILEIMDEVIKEPSEGSEEYENGKRKSEAPDCEQTQEVIILPNEAEPERNEDGYLIR